MIATLQGLVSEKIGDIVVIDVQGVGYGVLVTNEDYGQLVSGQTAKVYIHEHIREQAHDLYAFCRLDTLRLFELLLTVTGVGPKMALNILSIGNTNDVRVAIAGGDIKYIQQASGVGKRVAERVVVELKDKVGLEGVDLAQAGLLQGNAALHGDEAAEALMALGYTSQDAATALQAIDPSLPVEERVTIALRGK